MHDLHALTSRSGCRFSLVNESIRLQPGLKVAQRSSALRLRLSAASLAALAITLTVILLW